jgi:hypothetical protein
VDTGARVTVRHRAIIPALVVVALCLHNPWGFVALPDMGIALVAGLSFVVLVPVWRSGSLLWSRVVGLMLMAILGAVLSALTSDAAMIGILGGFTRSSGALSMVVWLVALVAGMHLGPADRDAQRVWIMRSAAMFSLLVLLGRLGAPVVPIPGGSRATGPLGSSAFSAAVICAVITFGVPDFAHSKSSRRTESVIATSLCVAALFATGSRAALLGCFVAVSIALFTLHRTSAKVDGVNVRRIGLSIVAIGLVAVVSAAAFGLFDRLSSIGDTNGTAAGRTVLWRAGLRAISDHVLFGVGFDQQESAMGVALPANFEARFGDAVIVDRAHNWFIDMWLGGGALTTVALGLAMIMAFRRLRRDALGVVTMAGAAGYLVQAQFNFSLPAVEAMLWILVGVSLVPDASGERRSNRMMVPVIASGCLLIVPFVTNLIADVHLERGRRSEASGDSDEALSAFRSASGVAAWQPLLEEVIVRFSMRHGLDSVAMEAADEAIARSGGQFRWKELRAEALVDSGRFTDALASYEALTSERPNDSSTWRGLAMALSGLGFDERANDAMDRSVSLMREVAAE